MFLLFTFGAVTLLIVVGIIVLLVVASRSENYRATRLRKLEKRRESLSPEVFVATLEDLGYQPKLVAMLQKEMNWYMSEHPTFGWNPQDDADKDYDVPSENITELAERLFVLAQGQRPTRADWHAWQTTHPKEPIGVLENLLKFATKA